MIDEKQEALRELVAASREVARLHRSNRIRPAYTESGDPVPLDLEVNRALGRLTEAEYGYRALWEPN